MRGFFCRIVRAGGGADERGTALQPLLRAPILRGLDRRRRGAGRRRRPAAGALSPASHRRLLRRDRAPPQCPQGHHGRAARRSSASKGTLVQWIRDLLSGTYDRDYVTRRWRVGWRHVEIGLDQVYTNVALSRLRTGLIRSLHEAWPGEPRTLKATVRALNKLLDLDLAIIEDAYQSEYMARLQRTERLATLGQVAGGVAHELRNPLNVVKTSVYYLLNARQSHDREAGRTPPTHRTERRAGRQRHHGAIELRQDTPARIEANRS